ncbi:XRE family transcriptional regulator [Mucilaginibacter angelicae]|uniref:XRE family transcriptional regulator n=1 Tax=Mucilaginibacter angelicae TaxID=869718 RepID=A0ABV6L5D6_9SPHI
MCARKTGNDDDEELKAFYEKVGRRLKHFRKLKNFSDYDKFAYAHDLNRSQYGAYETGRNLNLKTLHLLLKLLEIDETTFFGDGFRET